MRGPAGGCCWWWSLAELIPEVAPAEVAPAEVFGVSEVAER